MKKKVTVLTVIMAMVLAIPAYAMATRAVDFVPDIVFDGTEATCTVFITGDRSTDYISATMTLKQGTRVIDEWEDSGYGVLAMEGITEVTRRKTYTLRVDATVNGVAQPTVTIARTND